MYSSTVLIYHIIVAAITITEYGIVIEEFGCICSDHLSCRIYLRAIASIALVSSCNRYGCFKMTGARTHTMTSRLVVVRHLEGLLCAVSPMGSLISVFDVTSLGELSSERRGSKYSGLSSYKRIPERRFYP